MNPQPLLSKRVDDIKLVLTAAARLMWPLLRLPLVALLTLIEPLMRFVFGLSMLVGIVAAIAFEISSLGPRFPFLGMFALSLGSGMILFLYYGLLALLSR